MLTEEKRKSLTFWLIVIVCAAPVVLATLTYYFFKPSKFVNYGQLVQPPIRLDSVAVKEISRPTAESALIDTNESRSEITNVGDLKGRWILAYIASEEQCGEECENTLYLTRQVRLMTGKNRFRVERAWIMFQDNPLIPNTNARDFKGLWTLKTNPKQSPFNSQPQSFVGVWIVDPMGRLIMRYPNEADPKKVYKDLSRLLKASRIG